MIAPRAATLVVAAGLVGGACESSSEGNHRDVPLASASSTLEAPTAAPTPLSSVAPSPSASASTVSSTAVTTPAMPREPSPRPKPADWDAASRFVTDVEGCELLVVREWVRAKCPEGMWIRDSNWGKPGVDYFEDGYGYQTELRLRPGALASGHNYPSGVKLLAVWPSADPQPRVLSLEAPSPEKGRKLPAPEAIPEVPTADSERPAEADWFVAVPVNTASTSPGQRCSLVVLGQWARLSCDAPKDASLSSWENLSGFGTKDVDHFVAAKGLAGERLQFEFRLRKGMDGRAALAWGFGSGGRVGLYAEWKEASDRPTDLSFRESYP